MKAITVKQPWAFLICAGVKPIENRTWKTNLRGRILIHAAKKSEKDLRVLSFPQYGDCCDKLKEKIPTKSFDYWDKSAIIGSVEIVDCVKNHPSIWAEKDVWNWVLENPVLFKDPILNLKGKLSFWEYDQYIHPVCGEPSDLTCARCGKYRCQEYRLHMSNLYNWVRLLQKLQ
jgi:hypothetical protein